MTNRIQNTSLAKDQGERGETASGAGDCAVVS